MKVLFVTLGFPPSDRSGADLLSFDISQKLAELGIEIHVLTLGSKSETLFLKRNLLVHRRRVPDLSRFRLPLMIPFQRFSIAMALAQEAKRLIRDYSIDVLHSMSTDGYFVTGEIPTVTYLMHPTMGDYIYTDSIVQKLYILSYAIRWEKKVLFNSDMLACCSYKAMMMFELQYPYLRGKIEVIHCGINVSRFKPIHDKGVRKLYGIRDSDIILLSPGGGRSERKGTLHLLEALHHLRRYTIKCLITGKSREAGWYKRLVNKIKRYNLKNVILTGELSYDDLPYYYSAADIVVFPSLFEGHPLPPMEAMACCKPVVCTDVSDHNMLFKNHEHAILIRVGDIEGLKSGIEALIESEELRENLAKRGRELVLKNLTVNHTAKKLSEVYEKLINEKR